MPNLNDVVSKPNSPAPATASRRPRTRLLKQWDVLAVLLLMLASLPLAWVSPKSLVVISRPGTFDDHWVLDAVYKTAHGTYFGRDVAFLYGPLAHWLLGAPPRMAGLSLGTIYTSYRTLVLWCAIVFGFLTLRLLLPEQPAWKRFLLLVLLTIFWTSWDGRTAFGILLFALFLRGWYDLRALRLKPLVLGCGAALLTAVAFWYSADTGVYGIAAFLIALGGVGWEARREPQKFKLYAVAVGAFAASFIILVFVINAIVASPMDFHFWQTSLALVSVHRWNEPAPMSETGAMHLLLPLVAGCVLFLLRLVIPANRQEVIAGRTGFLLSAFVFALLSMQSGLVRSDPNHIVFGIFPMVFFSGVILFSFRSRVASAVAALVAIASSLSFGQITPIFHPADLRYRLARSVHPMTSCPRGYKEFDRACFPADFAETLQTTVNYLQQGSNDRDSVLIFPYQYMFAVAARRNVAGNVEQSFLANGAYLSKFDIAGMERAAAPVGLYIPDATPSQYGSPILSLPIDEVSNFTRTPDVWFWVFRHYRFDRQVAPDIFGLRRDESRNSRISEHETPLAVALKTYPVSQPATVIDLGAPDFPAATDFLRLRMKVSYSPLWKLRKPERLQLEITRADGSRSLRSFVIEPNATSDVWFYPWNEADLSNYFDNDESRWRTSPRPPVVGLRLRVTPLDWFSQKPESIAIESADAVHFSLAQ
jgi:hypothetical protein